jgi:hypothetical protein
VVDDDEPVGLEGLQVKFDDERAVSDAGVMLVATLAKRLGIEALVVLGADSIDDCEVLRAGRTRRLLGGWLPAPSTLGTFLRAFTFGHIRQTVSLVRCAGG